MSRWLRVDQQPVTAVILVLFRAVLCGQLLLISIWGRQQIPTEYLQIEDIGSLFIPSDLFNLLSLGIPNPIFYSGIKISFQIFLIFGGLGLFKKWVYPFLALLGIYYFGLCYQFGYTSHYLSGHLIALMLLGFVNLPSFFQVVKNLDARNETKFENKRALNLFKILWISIFFSAGFEKMLGSGFKYLFSESHVNNIAFTRLYFADYPSFISTLGFARFAVETLKIHYLFGLGMILELATPLAFFNRVAQRIIVVGIFLMQLMIFLLFGLYHFWYFLPFYLLFFPESIFLRRKFF